MNSKLPAAQNTTRTAYAALMPGAAILLALVILAAGVIASGAPAQSASPLMLSQASMLLPAVA